MSQTVQHSLLDIGLDCFLIFHYKNKPISLSYLTAINCIHLLCKSWMCYPEAIKMLMSKIAYNIGQARNVSIFYCYFVGEMFIIYVVPPSHCRTIPPNVVSLSSKDHLGKQWRTENLCTVREPLSEPIEMCWNLKTFPVIPALPGTSMKGSIWKKLIFACLLVWKLPWWHALTVVDEFFLQFDFLINFFLSILLSTQPYSIAAENKVKTVLPRSACRPLWLAGKLGLPWQNYIHWRLKREDLSAHPLKNYWFLSKRCTDFGWQRTAQLNFAHELLAKRKLFLGSY